MTSSSITAEYLALILRDLPVYIDLSDDNSTRQRQRQRRHCSVFVGGRTRRPHSPRGPFVLLNLRRVTTRDTKWAPLRSLPLCSAAERTRLLAVYTRGIARRGAWTDISEVCIL